MSLVDRIKSGNEERGKNALGYNKEFFDFIDDTMEEYGNEICSAIGEELVNTFTSHPSADNIEVRCFEPIFGTPYALGDRIKYPKYMGSLWCEIRKNGSVKNSSIDVFKSILLKEFAMRQPNLTITTEEEQQAWCGTTEVTRYRGDYLDHYDKKNYGGCTYVIEQSPGYSNGANSTDTLLEYKLFQIFNDYVIPYLIEEGFVIEREMHPEFSNRSVDERKFGVTNVYDANQFIYIRVK